MSYRDCSITRRVKINTIAHIIKKCRNNPSYLAELRNEEATYSDMIDKTKNVIS